MEITIHVRVCAPFPHSLSAAEGGGVTGNDDSHVVYDKVHERI